MSASVLSQYSERVARSRAVQVRGRVTHVLGLVIEAQGPAVSIGELCYILDEDGRRLAAEVVGFRDQKVLLMPLGDMKGIHPGSEVIAAGHRLLVPAGRQVLGRVLDGLGRPIDGRGPVEAEAQCPIEREPINPLVRRRISEPLGTGVRSIDAVLTCGRGQRVGIFSGSGVGKSLLLGMIARQTEADVNVIGLIGERGREVREFLEKDLGEEGLKRSVVVVATSNQPALVRLKGAQTVAAIAEYFRDQGLDVMLMMDSLTRCAFWRQEFRSLGRRREVNYDRILDFRVMNPIDPRIWRTSGRLPWLRKKLIAEFEAVGNLYPDDLNVVKLDAIFAFKMIGHTGAYMSASLPLLRGLAPLFMKESIRAAISIDYRWRNHSQLVRGMLEKHRPALAALRTSWGGPATRIRLRCAHRFLPYGAFWARRLVQRVGRKAIGHPIWPEPPVEFFPTFRWRQAALRHADREGLLLPEKMRAGMLFEEEGLQALRNRAERETFGEDALLGRILTLEMAMREAAATLRSS